MSSQDPLPHGQGSAGAVNCRFNRTPTVREGILRQAYKSVAVLIFLFHLTGAGRLVCRDYFVGLQSGHVIVVRELHME